MNERAHKCNNYAYRFFAFLGSPCNRFSEGSLPITCLISLVWLFNCVWRIIGEHLFVFCSLTNCVCLIIVKSYDSYYFSAMSFSIDPPAYPESPSTFSKASALR